MATLSLQWPVVPRDWDGSSGYYIDDKDRIIAKRNRDPEIKDVCECSTLIRRLVQLQNGKTRPANAQGALDFVETFGFLQHRNGPENVSGVVERIRLARELVKCIDKKDWVGVQRWAVLHASKIRLKPTFTYFGPEERKDLFFEPTNLTDAIFFQALSDAADGTEFEKCDNPGCPDTATQPRWFRVGPGTGHSRVKRPRRYCSPTCQKADQYRRKQKGKAK